MSLTVTFQGASDDLIEIDGCPGADEFPAGRTDSGLFLLTSTEGKLVVKVAYDFNGCWSVAFMPHAEDVPIPAWPIRFGQPMNTYTACLEVDCPDDVTLTREDKQRED